MTTIIPDVASEDLFGVEICGVYPNMVTYVNGTYMDRGMQLYKDWTSIILKNI